MAYCKLREYSPNMSNLVTVNINSASLNFSAGHFTILSPITRERLHGHNYNLTAHLTVKIGINGMAFDYREYKNNLITIIKPLNQYFLLPSKSPYLKIEDAKNLWLAHFNQEIIPFLKDDVIILPISNITIEELANWILGELIAASTKLSLHNIQAISLSVANGPGYSATAMWQHINS